MPGQSNFYRTFKAINKNERIKRFRSLGDRFSDAITSAVGTPVFLLLNALLFLGWLLVNTGQFGEALIFDPYPFGLLTTAVSLEAIILAVFVLITQNRQSRHSDIRSELDYITDLQADAEINIMISILERIAKKHDVGVSDLLGQLEANQKEISDKHPLSKKDS
jgi:uncharacterized membrane protein